MSIRLVSINIWDLPVPLPGHDRARRRRRLLDQLPSLDADLVLIQEAFIPAFKGAVASALRGYIGDRYLGVRRRVGPIPMDGSGGLFTLSRWSHDSRYVPFKVFGAMRVDERVGRKGMLWSEVDAPSGPVLVGNTHLYAGQAVRDMRIRGIQTRLLLRQLERLPRLPTVIAGDFNMCAEVEDGGRPTGFDLMRAAGFREVAAGATAGMVTMSPPQNRYARYASLSPFDRRLTQVFVRDMTASAPPRVCLNEPAVSDHYGLAVELRIGKTGKGKRETHQTDAG